MPLLHYAKQWDHLPVKVKLEAAGRASGEGNSVESINGDRYYVFSEIASWCGNWIQSDCVFVHANFMTAGRRGVDMEMADHWRNKYGRWTYLMEL